jgi:nucleoside-diphosphate-sugar epimerase
VNGRKIVLVTGANGFVGRATLARLSNDATWTARAAVRRHVANSPAGSETIAVGDLGPDTEWRTAVRNADAVIHAAARVHVMRDTAGDPLALFRRVNVQGTERLAQEAAEAGVRRFVYISSIKVNGESTPLGAAFTERSIPHPADPYGISKHEAETALAEIGRATGMEVVVVRPPLVYGPGVKANFLSMMKWINRGLPIPLGSVHNRRSLVAVDNLADLIVEALGNPRAANQTFLASDGEDLSTSDLMRRVGAALGRPARLVPVPTSLLIASLAAIGKRRIAERLLWSLEVDSSKARSLLDWRPPLTVDAGLRLAAEAFQRDFRS